MTRLIWGLVIGILLAPAPARAQADEVVYYHTDAVGSVRMVTDASGAVVARYDYLPFGELWPTVPPNPDPDVRQFAGKERDPETGLDYFGARYYRAQSGLFLSGDPGHVGADIFNPQSWNAYSYALNNPLRFVDPMGTCSQDAKGNYFDADDAGTLVAPGLCAINKGALDAGVELRVSVNRRRSNAFDSFIFETGTLADRWLREQATEMAVGAVIAATGGLASSALSGGLVGEGLSVTGKLAPLKYGKQAGKLARQMAARGWTDGMIREAVASGQRFQTINKATGNPAIRFVHPGTGLSMVVDTITKEIIHVGGRGFLY